MELLSERLSYRQFTPADFTDYLGLATDESVMRYITGRALTETEALTRFENYLKTNQLHPGAGFFAVRTKAEATFIGLAKFAYTTNQQVEIGYSLLLGYWGQRYTSELIRCLLSYADTIPQLTQLIALVDPANTVSIRLLTNHRFTLAQAQSPSTLYYQLDRPFSDLYINLR